MPVTLWHYTSTENAEKILTGGFLDNKFGYNQFTAAGDTTFKDWGPALIEVTLDVNDEDLCLKRIKQVSVDPADGYRQITYDIPAVFLNAHTIAKRLVSPSQTEGPDPIPTV